MIPNVVAESPPLLIVTIAHLDDRRNRRLLLNDVDRILAGEDHDLEGG